MQVVAIKRNAAWEELPPSVTLATRRWCERRVLAAPSGIDYYEAQDPCMAAEEIERAAAAAVDAALGVSCSAEVVPLPAGLNLDVASMFPEARISEVRHTFRMPQRPVTRPSLPQSRVA